MFIVKRMKKLQKAPVIVLWLWGVAKAVGGLGLGFLIAAYHPEWVSSQIGWTLLVAAVIIAIPAIKRSFS